MAAARGGLGRSAHAGRGRAGGGNLRVELTHASFRYGSTERGESASALEDVTLGLTSGECVLLLGRSGAGKSTLLHLLAGLIQPTSGEVRVLAAPPPSGAGSPAPPALSRGERAPLPASPRPRVPASGSPPPPLPHSPTPNASLAPPIGLVLQQPERQLVCDSVFDEVALGLRRPGRARGAEMRPGEGEIEQRVQEALALVGLEPARYAPRHPRRLSGGEQRRLAVACALALRPGFLLLDEPLAGLDQPGRRALLALLERARDECRGILIATHDVQPLLPVVSRVLVLRQGRLAADGTPEQVLADPSILRQAGLAPLPLAAVAQELHARGLPRLPWRKPEGLAEGILCAGEGRGVVLPTPEGRRGEPGAAPGTIAPTSPGSPPPARATQRVAPTDPSTWSPSPASPGPGFPSPPALSPGASGLFPASPRPPSPPRPLAPSPARENSPVRNPTLDPRAKLLAVVLLVAPLLLAPSPGVVLGYAAVIALAALASGRAAAVGRGLLPIVWLALGLVGFTALVTPEGRMWVGGVVPFSAVGAANGALFGLRMVELVGLGVLLAATTSPPSIAAALQWLLRPTRRLGVDVQAVGLLTLLVFRFVPMFRAELAITERAMALRGVRFGSGPLEQIRRLSLLPVPVLARLLAAADELAAALVVQGYGLRQEVAPAGFRIGPADLALLGASLMIAGGSFLFG